MGMIWRITDNRKYLAKALWIQEWWNHCRICCILFIVCMPLVWCSSRINISDFTGYRVERWHCVKSWWLFGSTKSYPDSKVHETYMGPTWVLSAPGGHHVGPMNLAIRVTLHHSLSLMASSQRRSVMPKEVSWDSILSHCCVCGGHYLRLELDFVDKRMMISPGNVLKIDPWV